MSVEKIESKAFQRAALNSESLRILGLLALLGALLLYATVSGLAAGQLRLLLAQTLVLALAIAYEAFMLTVVERALRQGREVASVMWLPAVVIETQLPTMALFLLTKTPTNSPYEVLVMPPVLLYFLFITLSTLRLSPALSLLTGLLSAAGYLATALYVHYQHGNPDAGPASFPPIYLIYAGPILAAGMVAAIVAKQIRRHVSAALKEAELQRQVDRVTHDLDIARSIQQGLLPTRSPRLDDFEVAGWNQPADQTGGDYFDWQALPDGRLAVSLGDASGHGIGPALVMASCRAYARASVLADRRPDGLLDRLNCLLAEDLSTNRFVTFVVAFLDPALSQLQVLSAGHGPIIWYQYAADNIEKLEAQGIPLGMIEGVTYGRATDVSLAAGDMLVLVTDGFYEWENPEGEQFGLQRLEAVIRASRDLPAEQVIARLRSAVADFCRGTEQLDDLTAVILTRKTASVAAEKTAGRDVRMANQEAAPAFHAAAAPPTTA